MRCPKCSEPIAFEATSHEACGWNVRPQEPVERATYTPPSQPRTDEQRDPAGWKRVQEAIAKIGAVTATGRDPKAWAKSIIADIRAGKYVIPIAKTKACEALHLNEEDIHE